MAKDLNYKAVKVNSKEEAIEILDWLMENYPDYNYHGSRSGEGWMRYKNCEDRYINIYKNTVYTPASEFIEPGTQIISKKEFMSETLEQQKEKLQKQLEEIENKIKEENEIKVGDYIIRINENHVGMKIGDIDQVVRMNYDGYQLNKFKGEIGATHNKKNFRKASKKEVEDYLASIPKTKEYILNKDYNITISKDFFKVNNGSEFPLTFIEKLVNTKFDQIAGYDVLLEDAKFAIGCQKVSLRQIKGILAIAESLK